MTTVVFETHSTTEDNEAGIATGWLPGRLSATGRAQAAELGRRRRDDGIDAIFASDLARAVETTRIAFDGTGIPVYLPSGRIVVIGHVATQRALEQRVGGRRLEDLAAEPFAWQPGWEYEL